VTAAGHPDPSAWARINDLFHRAAELPAQDRARFLENTEPDAGIRAEVLSLLDVHARAGGFIETPAGRIATPAVPETIGAYRIERVLGQGGMGVVYLAVDTRLGRTVALKAVAPAFAGDATKRDRLRREARAAASLNHPGIAMVYALEEIDGELYIAGEHVPGETLRDELARGPLSIPDAAATIAAIARALAAAHQQGIVHRDLKPENIVRTPDGGIKILDFGLARVREATTDSSTNLSADGRVFGTPAYMSPEQIRGGPADARSDIFALGIMLYECVTGTNPFAGSSPASTIARILESEPPRLTDAIVALPAGSIAGLERVVLTCLRKAPDARFRSAEDLARALDDLLASPEVLPAAAPSTRAGRRDAVSRALWWWQFHQAAATAIYAALVVLMWRARHIAPGSAGTLLFLGGLVGAIVASAVRLNTWFTLTLDLASWQAHEGRTRALRASADVLFAAALAAEGIRSLPVDEHWGVFLVAAAAAVLVSFAVVEPATRRALER
jgi:serine/threonine protein kinase